jgi:hypothetical protein
VWGGRLILADTQLGGTTLSNANSHSNWLVTLGDAGEQLLRDRFAAVPWSRICSLSFWLDAASTASSAPSALPFLQEMRRVSASWVAGAGFTLPGADVL